MRRWVIRHHPALDGLEEEFSIVEVGEIVAVFDRRFYAELTMAARILLEDLAEAERVPVRTLVRDILRKTGERKGKSDGPYQESQGGDQEA